MSRSLTHVLISFVVHLISYTSKNVLHCSHLLFPSWARSSPDKAERSRRPSRCPGARNDLGTPYGSRVGAFAVCTISMHVGRELQQKIGVFFVIYRSLNMFLFIYGLKRIIRLESYGARVVITISLTLVHWLLSFITTCGGVEYIYNNICVWPCAHT